MKKVICLGSVTRDIFVTLEETRIIENKGDITAKKLMAFEFGAKEYADSFFEEVGGSATNVSVGLLKAGLRPFIFARVSKGEVGKWILKKLGKRKVKKNYIQQRGKGESEISVIISDKVNMDHIILRTGDSVEQFDVEKAIKKFRERVDWIFIASQKNNWEKNWELIKNFSVEKKAKIAVNPSGYQIKNNSKNLLEKISEADLIFLNRDEALEFVQNFSGEKKDEIDFLIKKIHQKENQVIIITDGEKGAYASNGKDLFFLAPFAEEKKDTVGAGDAFSSGFLASFVEDENIEKALAWGMANSGAVLSKKGAINGLLSRKELKNREKDFLGRIKKISK